MTARRPARLRRALIAPRAAGALLLAGCGEDADPGPEQTLPAEEEPPQAGPPADGEGIPLDEVEENDSAESCWTVIDGTVYDVTAWIDQHPGGPDRIEQLCGTDGTELFTGQHGGESGPE